MAIQRSINFTGAMHDMRAERRPEPLRTPEGGYDSGAIIRRAHRWARAMSHATPYRKRLGISLTSAWCLARSSGKPYSPKQADRRFPLSRLVANAQGRNGA